MPDLIVVSAPGPQGPAGTGGGGGGVTDGDKGDITVSGGGTTWTIDNNTITGQKIASLAISTAKLADNTVTFEKLRTIKGPAVIGREENTTGDVTDLTLGTGLLVSGGVISVSVPNVVVDSRQFTAGTGITGGGDLSADRSFAVDFATSGTTSTTKAVRADDSRLSDARTPTAHTHALADIQQGGATSGQVLEWSGSAWAPATLSGGGGGTVTSVTAGDGLLGGTITASGTIDVNFGTAGNTVCEGNDQRLSDARTPTAHTHGLTDSYVGEIATPAARTYTIDLSAATARTITRLDFKTSAGTVDVTLKNGANNIYTADGLGTTQTTVTTGLSNTSLAANAALTLVVDAVSSPANLSFAVRYTDATGAIS